MKVLLFFVVIALVWGGGQGVYTMLTSSKLESFSVEEYHEKSPDAKWIKITDCTLNHADAVFEKSRIGGKIKEAYIPIYPPGDEGEKPKVKILLATKNPETLSLVQQLSELGNEAEALKFMVSNADKIVTKRDIEGLVRFGIDLDDRDARKIKELNSNLADEFIILDEGMKPEWHGVIMLPAGIALAYFLYFRKKKQPVLPQAPGTSFSAGSPAPMPQATSPAAPQQPAAEGIKFHCPSCNQKYSVGPEMSGQEVTCTQCNATMQIP